HCMVLVSSTNITATGCHFDMVDLTKNAVYVQTASGTTAAGNNMICMGCFSDATTFTNSDAYVTQIGTLANKLSGDTNQIPRFDIDQTAPTLIQKRTIRANIGFNDSWLTANLVALSSGESAKLRFAYCSDCYSSANDAENGTGDLCVWNGFRWVTQSDGIAPTTDFLTYALNITRRGRHCTSPYVYVCGDSNSTTALAGSAASGTAASAGAFIATSTPVFGIQSTTGSTSTGAYRCWPFLSCNTSFGSGPRRSIAVVVSLESNSNVSNSGVDELHWRFGLETPTSNATAAAQVDMVSFLMDDKNTLGFGATGSNLYALVRANSSVTDFVDSTVAAAGYGFFIATWEPTSGFTGRIRLAIATNLGASITTIVDRTTALSSGGSLQAVLACAKTLGTTAKVVNRRFIKSVLVSTSGGGGSNFVV
ncbi:MAG: hypothetical protein WCK25_06155, partial [Actinomycetes bacterium]